MSDDYDVYEAIACAVADLREPDLSPFAPLAVRSALERALRLPAARAEFLGWLDGRVRHLSGERVSIEERLDGTAPTPSPDAAPEMPLRVVLRGEPFVESAILRADSGVLHYPMRR